MRWKIKQIIKKYRRLSLWLAYRMSRAAANVYRKILGSYNFGTYILLFPYDWLGDAFYVFSKLNTYLGLKKIIRYEIYVINYKHKEIAEMFGFEAKIISRHNMKQLMRYFTAIGQTCGLKVLIMHHDPQFVRCNHANNWYKDNNYNLGSLLDYVVFDGNHIRSACPCGFLLRHQAEHLLRNKGLTPGKTIVISPVSYTLHNDDVYFWMDLIERAKSIGYKVCCTLSPEEPDPYGIPAIKVGLKDISTIVESAGYFVGSRSGLCDILAFSECRKIILYSKDCSERDKQYFDLNDIWHTHDFTELRLSGNNESDIDKILLFLKRKRK